jgi:glycosyltransferase involved in cell wall biosynthesis
MKQGIIIPVYNHGKTVLPIARKLSGMGLPVILVDDGSDVETKAYLAETAEIPAAVLVTLKKNGGKGGAVCAGIEKAHELGLTHALQIDADGQHDVSQVEFFLKESRLHPEAAICAWPEYGEDVPRSRRYGRVAANVWAKIVSLSTNIADAMVGFRVYPVEKVWKITRKHKCDSRMGFDIEILVRMHWENIRFIFHPVRITYPEDGVSHYHVVRDNFRIFWVFARLFFGGTIFRLPGHIYRLLTRKKA